jgi:hypothetical protein
MSPANPPQPDKPDPQFTYEGSGITLDPGTLSLGPFTAPYPAVVFGHAVAFEEDAGIPTISLRPAATLLEDDPCTELFGMRYDQHGIEWEMIFRITTDPKGGLVGTSFALLTQSSYPQIPMSVSKIEVNQPAFGALVRGFLPGDYLATIVTKFWDNGNKDLPLDAWLMLEIAYVPNDHWGKEWDDDDSIPMEPLGEVVLYPAHQGSSGPVLGDNYPAQVRARAAG